MKTTFTYAVVNAQNQTLCVRANRGQAIECLRYFRTDFQGKGIRCRLVFEVTTPSGVSTETEVIGFDEPTEKGK